MSQQQGGSLFYKTAQMPNYQSQIDEDQEKQEQAQQKKILRQATIKPNQEPQVQQYIEQQHKQGVQQDQEILKNVIQDTQKVQVAQKNQGIFSNFDITNTNHPYACLFHVLFKGGALFCHFFLSLFVTGYSLYEVIIILNAFDFWTVKNVTGRLLVGLRWWSEHQPDGHDKWVFECKVQEQTLNPKHEYWFWGFQTISTLAWFLLFIVNALALDLTDCSTVIFGFICSGTNLWAYYKCSRVQKQRVRDLASKLGANFALGLMNTSVKMPVNI